MNKIKSIFENKKFQTIGTIILLVVALFMLFNILHLRTEINLLSINNDYVSDVVKDLQNESNRKEEIINNYKVDEVLQLEQEINTLVNDIDNISSNYVDKDQFNELQEKISAVIKNTNDAAGYSFEDDLDKAAEKTEAQKPQIDNLEDVKKDKSEKVDDVDGAENPQYPSIAAARNEENKLYDAIYPIGSIYISINNAPPAYGEWEKLESGRVLWNTENGGGDLLDPTLPNVTGQFGLSPYSGSFTGPFYSTGASNQKNGGSGTDFYQIYADFNRYNPIYQDGATVRPPAITVTMFKRIG